MSDDDHIDLQESSAPSRGQLRRRQEEDALQIGPRKKPYVTSFVNLSCI
jgi:hypothetical protein